MREIHLSKTQYLSATMIALMFALVIAALVIAVSVTSEHTAQTWAVGAFVGVNALAVIHRRISGVKIGFFDLTSALLAVGGIFFLI